MTTCQHKPRRADLDAGYSACMFCVETGECDGRLWYCRTHRFTWERWQEEEANARNSAF